MNEIDKKITELMDLISEQEEVKRYKLIEKALDQNDLVKNKIENFKNLQKKMAIYESSHDKVPIEMSQKYDQLFNDLLDIPIYNEYLALQEEINDLLQQITSIIEEELNKK